MKLHYSLPTSRNNNNLKALEEEIEVELKDSGDASDKEFFTFKEQEIIYEYYEAVKKQILLTYPEDSEAHEVVEDIKVVQENITKISKKKFKEAFIKIRAKARQHSMKFAKDFGGAIQKKFFDRVLSGKIIDDGRKAIDYVQDLFSA